MVRREEISVSLDPDDLARLRAVWEELRRAGRKGRPEYIGQRLTFNSWLARLAAEAGTRAGAALAAAAEAAIGGTIGDEMTRTSAAPRGQTAKTTAPPRRRGRPPGRKKVHVSFSVDPDVADYVRELGSAAVNDLLRRSMVRKSTR